MASWQRRATRRARSSEADLDHRSAGRNRELPVPASRLGASASRCATPAALVVGVVHDPNRDETFAAVPRRRARP